MSSIRQLPSTERKLLRQLLEDEDSPKGPTNWTNGFDNERLTKSLRWLNENRDQYLGYWVSLDGDRFIASGSSARDVFSKAKAKGVASPFVEFVAEDNPIPFTGGWLS